MGMYLLNFLVYAMAMVGILFVCLMVFKKTMLNNKHTKNNKNLDIESALNLSPRKTLYVIKAGTEKFLIAADAERTTFLSKLTSTEAVPAINGYSYPQAATQKKAEENRSVDYSEVMAAIGKTNSNKSPMMREIMQKLNK